MEAFSYCGVGRSLVVGFALLFAALPLLMYLPAHLLCCWLFRPPQSMFADNPDQSREPGLAT